MKEKLQKTFVEFLIAYAIWILLVLSKQTDYRLDTQSLLAGVLAAGLCASLFGKIYPSPMDQCNQYRKEYLFY